MNYTPVQWWERFQKYYTEFTEAGLAVDLSRMNLDDAFFAAMEPKIQAAFAAMDDLEAGAIANPDEKRMVGHYWLRNSALAPSTELRHEIDGALQKIKLFTERVHKGEVAGAGGKFSNLLLVGIGGSALGPQFVAQALGHPHRDQLKPYFFDNTDPDGMERVLAALGAELNRTLVIVISKSGGTKETRNGMLVAQAAYEKAGLNFGRHAVAVTMTGSELDKYSIAHQWLERFPMWDWVGGRTSELSAVGLLPAALQGIDVDGMLAGARAVDILTRNKNVKANPAAQLALAWYVSGNGKGTKNLVVLPYKDRLELFSKYLQQLIMESLGKELDLNGEVVNQGICVFGNKGSTDQHSYIQQLRDGLNNFFVTFIEVGKDEPGHPVLTEPDVTSGDFLEGFFLGTRSALAENDRQSITLTVPDVTPQVVGMLIALFERTVGFYATLINVNAYHQPGVEAGKKAAASVIEVQRAILAFLKARHNQPFTVEEIAQGIQRPNDIETIFKVVNHLAANPARQVVKESAKNPFAARYKMV